MGIEKRKHARVSTNLFVNITHPALSNGTQRGVAVDVSLSGFAFESQAEFPQNEELECEIEIPFRVKGRVIRRVGEGQVKKYGVQFQDLSFFDRILLKKALKSRRHTGKI